MKKNLFWICFGAFVVVCLGAAITTYDTLKLTGLAGGGTRSIGVDNNGLVIAVASGGNGPFTNDLHYYNPGSDPADAKITLDISQRTLNDGAGNLVMDFSTDRELFDDTGTLAATFRNSGRALADDGAITSVNWGDRALWGIGNGPCLDWNQRFLYASDESTVVFNWAAPTIMFANVSMSLTNGIRAPTNTAPANVTVGVTAPDSWIVVTNHAGLRLKIPAWKEH